MLTESQTNRVWQDAFEAEVRAFYFGDLAARYIRQKQIITGVSFFLSSGAAATLIARSPSLIPVILSIIAAVLSAYSISSNLDKRALSMSKLHSTWNRLAVEYDRLWNHWYEDEAERQLVELQDRSIAASEAGTEPPYDEPLLEKWGKVASEKYKNRLAA